MDGIRMLGFALSPLMVLLFAAEMSSLDARGRKRGDRRDSLLVAFYVFKLPLGILAPVASPFWGSALLLAADALSLCAVAARARAESRVMKAQASRS